MTQPEPIAPTQPGKINDFLSTGRLAMVHYGPNGQFVSGEIADVDGRGILIGTQNNATPGRPVFIPWASILRIETN